MEILTVKNNKMDYSAFKKVSFHFFPVFYTLFLIVAFCLSWITLFMNLSAGHVIYSVISVSNLILICSQPRRLSKKIIKQLNKSLQTNYYIYDLVFYEDKLTTVIDSVENKASIKYTNIKNIIETKDVVLFTSKAGFKIYFEKKNASNEDIERLHVFFDKQNIKWRKSIL